MKKQIQASFAKLIGAGYGRHNRAIIRIRWLNIKRLVRFWIAKDYIVRQFGVIIPIAGAY